MADSEAIPRLFVDPSDGGIEQLSRIDKRGFEDGVALALDLLRAREQAEQPSAPTSDAA